MVQPLELHEVSTARPGMLRGGGRRWHRVEQARPHAGASGDPQVAGSGCAGGQVIQGYFTAAPAGFLMCNGALVSRAAYPALWAHANGAGLVAPDATWLASAWTLFGAGDGSTTFRPPDLRAEFIRGADAGRGEDAGRALGTWQAGALQAHAHPLDDSILTEGVPGGGLGGSTSGVSGVPVATGSTGGPEARPRNAALAYCVRF